MKYQTYPNYKPSGVEWLGDVPEHWEVKRLKFIVSAPLMYGANEAALDTNIEHPRFIRITDVDVDGSLREDTFRSLNEELAKSFMLAEGDVLLARSGGTVGKSFIYANSWGRCCFAGYLIKASIRQNNVLAEWFYQFTQTQYYWEWIASNQIQATIQNVSADKYNNFFLTVPAMAEQQKIAQFLDHETAKIDTLIEKQQRLIALLKEKRQAVISHAVTKGLNPNAPMKPSGVEWLGDVPVGWEVAKLSYRYGVLLGKMLDDKKITGNYLGAYIRNTDVQWDSINDEELPEMDFKPEEIDRYSVKKGDLVVCEGGEIGRAAIWEKETPCFYQKALHRLRPINAIKDDTRFMFYVLFDAVHQERFISGAGKATIAHLPAETFRQYRFAYPSYEEQKEISRFLDDKKKKFDDLNLQAEKAIELLKERRTALISAAVTGKIDVRDWGD